MQTPPIVERYFDRHPPAGRDSLAPPVGGAGVPGRPGLGPRTDGEFTVAELTRTVRD